MLLFCAYVHITSSFACNYNRFLYLSLINTPYYHIIATNTNIVNQSITCILDVCMYIHANVLFLVVAIQFVLGVLSVAIQFVLGTLSLYFTCNNGGGPEVVGIQLWWQSSSGGNPDPPSATTCMHVRIRT